MANGRSVNAKDVMSVMSLRAKPGTQLHILTTGPDEIAALESLSAMLHTQESF
jgi:phosphotransferase system HPr (HPr) family protein